MHSFALQGLENRVLRAASQLPGLPRLSGRLVRHKWGALRQLDGMCHQRECAVVRPLLVDALLSGCLSVCALVCVCACLLVRAVFFPLTSFTCITALCAEYPE